MTKHTRGYHPLIAFVVAVVGLLLVFGAQQFPNRHRMEADLTSRSEQALRTAGLSQVRVSFTGRDGTLRADSPAEAERALRVVRGLEGVRVAEAQVPPASETAPPPVPPSVLVASHGGRVAVSGRVPTGVARTALTGAAAATFGAAAVDDRLTVGDDVTDAALSGLPAVVAAFGADTDDATLRLENGTLLLTGTVPSQARRTAVLAAARGTGATVVDQLRVTDVRQLLAAVPPLTFRLGGVGLGPDDRASLRTVGRILRDNPDVRIRVEGHTDSSGSAASNLVLSRARADSVRDFLLTQGVAADRMSAKGYGETRPKVPDTSAANRETNRRVELVVTDGAVAGPGSTDGP